MTTKSVKTEKRNSKKRIGLCSGDPCSQSRRRKEGYGGGGFAEKEGFKSGMKE